jgi:hypothetical protein
MKKLNLSILFLFVTFFIGFSQVPGAFNYQAVIRTSSGDIVPNQNVSFKISILQNSESGTVVYTETHSAVTSAFGLANLKIGEGTVVSGTFSPAGWGSALHFIKIEIDPEGGTAFTHIGTSQLLSVPYAFHAQTVTEDNVEDADADPVNELQTISLSGTQLSLSDGGGSVTLPSSGEGGDNWGTQNVVTDGTLSGNGTTASPLSVEGDLSDDQTLSISGNELSISEGNTVTLPTYESSLWTQYGDNLNYISGSVGIGANPSENVLFGSYSSDKYAIAAQNNSTVNSALFAWNKGNGPSAHFMNKLRITDGTEGLGKILTSDGNGFTSWQTPASNLWTQNGNILSYPSGTVEIGTIPIADESVLLDVRTPSKDIAFYAENNNNINATIQVRNLGAGGAAWFHNKIKISDGSQGAGKVLTSDADGVASWQTPVTSGNLWTESENSIYRSSGNVGIGNTNPTKKLEVKGDIKIDYVDTNNGLYFQSQNGENITFHCSENDLRLDSWSGGRIMFGTLASNGGSVPRLTINPNTGNIDVTNNLSIGEDLTVNGGNFELNSTDENWLSVLRGTNQNAGIAFKETGAASTQWIFPYFRGWQSDNLIVRDEAARIDVMTFTAGNGRVGIGTSSPSSILHVAGTITEDSDIRLKENINTINSALTKISQIRGVSFDWKDKVKHDNHTQLGVIAQEVKEVFPELVFVSDDKIGTLSVNYDGLVAPLIEAVKEQQKIIDALKGENIQLKANNMEIISRLEKLENLMSGSAQK